MILQPCNVRLFFRSVCTKALVVSFIWIYDCVEINGDLLNVDY